MTALSEAPDLYELPEDPEARKRWRIEHDGQATWVMRKLRDAAIARRKDEDTAEAEISRIERWLAGRRAAVDQDTAHLEGLLADYLTRVRAASGEQVKHLDTPYGKVQTRTTPPRWEQDSEVLVAWALEHRPDLVTTVQSVNLTAAKKVLGAAGSEAVDPDTGALVPGITVTPGGVSVSVQLDLGGAR